MCGEDGMEDDENIDKQKGTSWLECAYAKSLTYYERSEVETMIVIWMILKMHKKTHSSK